MPLLSRHQPEAVATVKRTLIYSSVSPIPPSRFFPGIAGRCRRSPPHLILVSSRHVTNFYDLDMPFTTRIVRREHVYHNGSAVQPSIQERRGLSLCSMIQLPDRVQGDYDSAYPTVSPSHLPGTPSIEYVGLQFESPASAYPPVATPHRTLRRSRGLHWPSARLSPMRPATRRLGPFEFLRQLHSGTFGSAISARDLSNGRRVCLKVVDKSRVGPESRELRALQTELQAYQVIADSEPSRFIMDCHGVFQDEQSVYFAMVSEHSQHLFSAY